MKTTFRRLILAVAVATVLSGAAATSLQVQPGELEVLRRKAAELERHVAELRERGKPEAAREAQAELLRVRHALQQVAEEREREQAGREALERERDELRRHVAELERRAAELRERGKVEEARETQAELQRLRNRLQEMAFRGEMDRPGRAERAQRREAAEREHREVSRPRRREVSRPRRPQPRLLEPAPMAPRPLLKPLPPGLPPEELERRLHHLEVALDNLRAGGFEEAVRRLEPLAGELHRALEQRRFGPMPPVQALRGALERSQHQINELREMMAHLNERLERLERRVAADDDDHEAEHERERVEKKKAQKDRHKEREHEDEEEHED